MPYKRNHMHIDVVCVPASEWEFQLCGKPLELSFQLIKDKLYVHVYLVYFHSMCNKTVLLLVFAASSYLIMYLLTHSNYPPHHQIRTQLISHSFSTSSFALWCKEGVLCMRVHSNKMIFSNFIHLSMNALWLWAVTMWIWCVVYVFYMRIWTYVFMLFMLECVSEHFFLFNSCSRFRCAEMGCTVLGYNWLRMMMMMMMSTVLIWSLWYETNDRTTYDWGWQWYESFVRKLLDRRMYMYRHIVYKKMFQLFVFRIWPNLTICTATRS